MTWHPTEGTTTAPNKTIHYYDDPGWQTGAPITPPVAKNPAFIGPYLCPKCDGEKVVLDASSGYANTGNKLTRTCPTCDGKGVLWQPNVT